MSQLPLYVTVTMPKDTALTHQIATTGGSRSWKALWLKGTRAAWPSVCPLCASRTPTVGAHVAIDTQAVFGVCLVPCCGGCNSNPSMGVRHATLQTETPLLVVGEAEAQRLRAQLMARTAAPLAAVREEHDALADFVQVLCPVPPERPVCEAMHLYYPPRSRAPSPLAQAPPPFRAPPPAAEEKKTTTRHLAPPAPAAEQKTKVLEEDADLRELEARVRLLKVGGCRTCQAPVCKSGACGGSSKLYCCAHCRCVKCRVARTQPRAAVPAWE